MSLSTLHLQNYCTMKPKAIRFFLVSTSTVFVVTQPDAGKCFTISIRKHCGLDLNFNSHCKFHLGTKSYIGVAYIYIYVYTLDNASIEPLIVPLLSTVNVGGAPNTYMYIYIYTPIYHTSKGCQ